MKILPLAQEYIDQAIDLCNKVFSSDIFSNNPPELGFKASLDKITYKDYWNKYNNIRIEYFVLINELDNVIGTTGIFQNTLEIETAWIGWFCVDPNERGNGYGKDLLKFTIDKAKDYGYKYLKLYTNPEELPEAQNLYKKFGFEFDKVSSDPTDKSIEVTILNKSL